MLPRWAASGLQYEPSHVKDMDGGGALSFLSLCVLACTISLILVFSGYELSIVGLTTWPIFVLGSLNGNSPANDKIFNFLHLFIHSSPIDRYDLYEPLTDLTIL